MNSIKKVGFVRWLKIKSAEDGEEMRRPLTDGPPIRAVCTSLEESAEDDEEMRRPFTLDGPPIRAVCTSLKELAVGTSRDGFAMNTFVCSARRIVSRTSS